MSYYTPAEIAMNAGYKCPRCGGKKFHMWTSPQETEHVSCDQCRYAPEVMPKPFVYWWRNHSHSGFLEDTEGLFHYSITPPEAWGIERYRVEYSDATGHNYKPRRVISEEEKARWRKEQEEAQAITAAIEKRYGSEFWKLPPEETMGRITKIYDELVKDGAIKSPLNFAGWNEATMRAKIDEAYAPEPGQSEEETELLRRRRKPEPKTMTAEEIQAKARAIFGA